ncbi:MAG: hypothetical protein QMD14_04205 [Candidatus Aenigmarchaeota archaeon]|nr:hypothetical protein [Candidatus Aenigmarchaeota archaeon]
MGIFDRLLWLFRKKRSPEAIESMQINQSITNQSINQSQINQSIIGKPEEKQPMVPLEEVPGPPRQIELEKESLQLGIAAGYTSKSLREIESSLNRIESQMVTKDWFSFQFEDKTPEIIEILRKHEENEGKRFEIIQNLLISLQKTTEKAPEPIKSELSAQIHAIEAQMPLTPKMQELVSIVKGAKEISYTDLASKLAISEDALRGLLSVTVRRTNKIQRFEKDNKGWVRYLAID